MQTHPVKPNPITPEFASTGFFMIFGVLFLLYTKYALLPLNVSHQIPLISSLVVILLIAAFLGRIFARSLVKKHHWLRLFLTGVFMALLALLIVSLTIFIRSWIVGTPLFQLAQHWQDYFIIYGLLVVTTSSVIGVWLGVLTGMAAIYFNKRFYPRLMAFDSTQATTKDSSND